MLREITQQQMLRFRLNSHCSSTRDSANVGNDAAIVSIIIAIQQRPIIRYARENSNYLPPPPEILITLK